MLARSELTPTAPLDDEGQRWPGLSDPRNAEVRLLGTAALMGAAGADLSGAVLQEVSILLCRVREEAVAPAHPM